MITLLMASYIEVTGGYHFAGIQAHAAAPSEPFACNASNVGKGVSVDDNDNNAWSRVCVCMATSDDGAGAPDAWDWRDIESPITDACPSF